MFEYKLRKQAESQLKPVKVKKENEYKVACRPHPKATAISTLVMGGMLLLGCTQANSPANPPERVVVNPSPSVIEPTTSNVRAEPFAGQTVSEESANTQQNTSQAQSVPTPTATTTINWGTLDSKEVKSISALVQELLIKLLATVLTVIAFSS